MTKILVIEDEAPLREEILDMLSLEVKLNWDDMRPSPNYPTKSSTCYERVSSLGYRKNFVLPLTLSWDSRRC